MYIICGHKVLNKGNAETVYMLFFISLHNCVIACNVYYYNKNLTLYMFSQFTLICSHLISQDRKLYTC